MGGLTYRQKQRLQLVYGGLRHWFGSSPGSHKIFIIGTGRSGTHWLGYILDAHPDIYVTVEKRPIFQWVTAMALDPASRERLFPKLIRRYRFEHAAVAPMHYADKSHPNIWIAERLADVFPEACFIGIRRGVFATVASMLKHPGVMQWIHQWRRYPIPNRFLGIGIKEARYYEDLPLPARCALRWHSHSQRLDELQNLLGDRFLGTQYESLQTDTEAELERIAEFLGLRSAIPVPEIKRESLERWRNELSVKDVADIRRVCGEASGREFSLQH